MANENALSFLKDVCPKKFRSIKIIPTNEIEIKDIICILKTKNPSGFDEAIRKF
jgi:hypothetical protein